MKDLVKKGADANAIYDAYIPGRHRPHPRPLPAPPTTAPTASTGSSTWKSRLPSPTPRQETTAEALRLWKSLNRPNAMIKIPGTNEGLPAIEEAFFNGVNINVTLLFSVDAYEKVARTYIKALKHRGGPASPSIASPRSPVSSSPALMWRSTSASTPASRKSPTPARRPSLKPSRARSPSHGKNAYASFQKIFSEPD